MKKNIFLHDKKYLLSWKEIQSNKSTPPTLLPYRKGKRFSLLLESSLTDIVKSSFIKGKVPSMKDIRFYRKRQKSPIHFYVKVKLALHSHYYFKQYNSTQKRAWIFIIPKKTKKHWTKKQYIQRISYLCKQK